MNLPRKQPQSPSRCAAGPRPAAFCFTLGRGVAWALFLFCFFVGCRQGREFSPLSPNDKSDIRAALGEKEKILEISEYGEIIFIILEYPRRRTIDEVSGRAVASLRRVQKELARTIHSQRPLKLWAHSESGGKSTFQILGYASANSASAEIVWMTNQLRKTEVPVRNRQR